MLTSLITCLYSNSTTKIQVVRLEDAPHNYIERTLMPQQRICFQAIRDSYLEVQSAVFNGALDPDRIPCSELEMLNNLSCAAA
ncbi:MAG: DUF1830 domain-containing protein [Cyanobacteria bacterium P01_A01_bin.135]